MLEIRPEKLSYLLDIEGKLLICSRFMTKPIEGRVSDFQVQDQDQGGAQSAEEFAPRKSERLKNLNSTTKCAPKRQSCQAA